MDLNRPRRLSLIECLPALSSDLMNLEDTYLSTCILTSLIIPCYTQLLHKPT